MPPVTLSRAGRACRLAVTVTVLALLGWGSLVGQDDDFPIGPFVMFAFTTPPNGDVRSVGLEAVTDRGQRLSVPTEPTAVGLRRAEVEGQLPRVVTHPELLARVAEAHARLHPREPRFVQVDLVRHTVHLRHGVATGEAHEVLATWRAEPP